MATLTALLWRCARRLSSAGPPCRARCRLGCFSPRIRGAFARSGPVALRHVAFACRACSLSTGFDLSLAHRPISRAPSSSLSSCLCARRATLVFVVLYAPRPSTSSWSRPCCSTGLEGARASVLGASGGRAHTVCVRDLLRRLRSSLASALRARGSWSRSSSLACLAGVSSAIAALAAAPRESLGYVAPHAYEFAGPSLSLLFARRRRSYSAGRSMRRSARPPRSEASVVLVLLYNSLCTRFREREAAWTKSSRGAPPQWAVAWPRRCWSRCIRPIAHLRSTQPPAGARSSSVASPLGAYHPGRRWCVGSHLLSRRPRRHTDARGQAVVTVRVWGSSLEAYSLRDESGFSRLCAAAHDRGLGQLLSFLAWRHVPGWFETIHEQRARFRGGPKSLILPEEV